MNPFSKRTGSTSLALLAAVVMICAGFAMISEDAEAYDGATYAVQRGQSVNIPSGVDGGHWCSSSNANLYFANTWTWVGNGMYDSHLANGEQTIVLTITENLPSGTYTLRWDIFSVDDDCQSCSCTVIVRDPLSFSVSDASITCGSVYSATVVSGGNITGLTGASWLTYSGQTVSGVAPSVPGDYTVTVYCGESHASYVIHVVSKLAPTNSPANGTIILPK
ncbi:hypothetical protein TALC_00378 [Thermoplasmatales archaeon BRNA1]|nr:hypothetical protein TALC_00378 [Thermoplasmatales archaeon BRNA1]